MPLGPLTQHQWDADISWSAVGHQWALRQDHELRAALGARGMGAEIESALVLLSHRRVSAEQALAAVSAMVRRAGEDANRRALLAAFLYLRALIAWEMSMDSDHLRHLLNATEQCLGASSGSPAVTADPAQQCVQAVIILTASVHEQLELENDMVCSCPGAVAERAPRLYALAERARNTLPEGEETPLSGLVGVLRGDATRTAVFYRALGRLAEADVALLSRRPQAGPAAAEAVRLARDTAREIYPDVLESELRAHTDAIERLAERSGEPELVLELGRFSFVYPFALPDIDPAELVDRMLQGTSERLTPPESLAGLRVGAPRRAELSDAWRNDGELDPHHRYSLAVLPLPQLELESPDGPTPFPFLPAVELSSLGTHCLRINVDVQNLAPHEIDQYFRRLGSQMGAETLRPMRGERAQVAGSDPGRRPPRWGLLLEFAAQVVEEFTGYAREALLDSAAHGALRNAGVDLRAGAHLIVVCRTLSMSDRPGIPIPAARLPESNGANALLLPRRNLAQALDDWARFDPPELNNVYDGLGRSADLVHCAAGTTVMYMPTTPSWALAAREEAAVLAATAPEVLAAWGDRIAAIVGEGEATMWAAIRSRGLDPLMERAKELARLNSEVHALLSRIKAVSLCTVEVQRRLVDRLLRQSGFEVLERRVNEQLASLAAHQELVSKETARIIERAEREERRAQAARARAEREASAERTKHEQAFRDRWERALQLVVVLLAFTGIAGVFDWLNTGFQWYEVLAVMLAQVLLFGLILMGAPMMYLYRLRKTRTRDAERRRESPLPRPE